MWYFILLLNVEYLLYVGGAMSGLLPVDTAATAVESYLVL